MQFSQLISKRYSVRHFKPEPLPSETLNSIMEAAIKAPSIGNLQGYGIIEVSDPSIRENLAVAASMQAFISQAPHILVFVTHNRLYAGRYGKEKSMHYAMQDATIAAAYAQLQATELEVGSIWIGIFNEAEVKEALELPPFLEPIVLMPVGYSDQQPLSPPRKPLAAMVTYRH